MDAQPMTEPDLQPRTDAENYARAVRNRPPSYCGCSLSEGVWGESGWHQTIRPNGTIVCIQRCPAYAEAMRRAKEREL